MPKRKRRPRESGTIFQRSNGKWFASVRYRKPDGSSARKTASANSKRHAEIVLEELIAKYATAENAEISQETVRGILDRYFRDRTQGLEVATKQSYQLGRKKLSSIEDWSIADLTPAKLSDLFSNLPCSLYQKSQAKNLLSRACDYAVSLEILSRNPCKAVKLPLGRAKKKIKVFEEDEVAKILQAFRGHRMEAYIYVLAHTGMRQEEINGLRWGDVDLENHVIHIRRAIVEVGGRQYEKSPKTLSSVRCVAITPEVAERLSQMERLSDDELVFRNLRGGPISRVNFSGHVWLPMLRSLGIPPRGAHALRHTVASHLVRSGAPLTATANYLGHTNPSVLLSVYTHFQKKDERVAAELMTGFATKPVQPIVQPISPKSDDCGRLKTSHDDCVVLEKES